MSEPSTEPLTVAVRAHTQPIPVDPKGIDAEQPAKRRKKPGDWKTLVHYLLIFDTETTADRYQSLKFGCWRFCEVAWEADGQVRLTYLEEGLLYADDLPDTDPAGYELLGRYVLTHDPKTSTEVWPVAPTISLCSRSEFVQLLNGAAYRVRATVVGFNLPFDLSRIAVDWGAARGKRFGGGFSLVLHDREDSTGRVYENPYRARLVVKTINSKASIISFTAPSETDAIDRVPEGRASERQDKTYRFRGHFLDLRTLAFSHTDRSLTLEGACEKFDTPYIKRDVQHGRITSEYVTYCREDADATERLCRALLQEHARHPVSLQPTKAYSPASLGKSYLHKMGVSPALDRAPDFPPEILGYAMTAYYGGRAECRIRRVSAPIVYCDFLSMYPTVCSLLELWSVMTSNTVKAVETDPRAIEQWLGSLDADSLLDPKHWPYLRALVQIEPIEDILPVRARYGDTRSYGIGVNHYTSPTPQWYALPDVAASALLTGCPARVLRALRIEGSPRRARGLKSVRLRGEVDIDPRSEDFFRRVIEQRKLSGRRTDLPAGEGKRLDRFLKVLANSTSYGIYAEMNRQEQPAGQHVPVAVHGLGNYTASVIAPEQPGPYYFPPIACLIPSAARLMLAVLEHIITGHGGVHAFCDTDSMAIVATRDGGVLPCPGGPYRTKDDRSAVRALSWEQVQDITRRFETLNPYNPADVPGSILEIEGVNYDSDADGNPTDRQRQLYCYAISAKRYALYTMSDGAPKLTALAEESDESEDETPPDSSRLLRLEEGKALSAPSGGEPKILEDGHAKQHGLGHLLNPTDPDAESRDWIPQLWDHVVRIDGHGLSSPEPAWLDRPALTRLAISTPRLLRPFERTNGKGSAKSATRRPNKPSRWRSTRTNAPHRRVRPYNFLLTAHVAPLGHPAGANPQRFQLVAPYSTDPRQWGKLAWIDTHTRHRYSITTTGPQGERMARVKTYRDVLAEYRTHPEPKSADPDGHPCDKATRGLLARRHVTPAGHIHHIGKESNKLEDLAAGLAHDPSEVLTDYPNPDHDDFKALIAPVLRELPLAEIASATGLSQRAIERARSGKTRPHPTTRAKLTARAALHARRWLREHGVKPSTDDLAALAAYLQDQQGSDDQADTDTAKCAGCEEPLQGQQRRWCSESCRKRTNRKAQRSPDATAAPKARCQGCGAPLQGRRRQWCSDACRMRHTRAGQHPQPAKPRG